MATNPNVSAAPDPRRPTALTREQIEAVFPGALREIGDYVTCGNDVDRRGAFKTALTHAHDICTVITLVNEQGSDKVEDDVFARLAGTAASFIEMAVRLSDHHTEG